jgi:hypothetical protein
VPVNRQNFLGVTQTPHQLQCHASTRAGRAMSRSTPTERDAIIRSPARHGRTVRAHNVG